MHQFKASLTTIRLAILLFFFVQPVCGLAQGYISLPALTDLTTALTKDKNTYDLKYSANAHGYFSEKLQGDYLDANGNSLSGFRKGNEIAVIYHLKSTAENLAIARKELQEYCYLSWKHKDGTELWYTYAGRFDIYITKKPTEWHYLISENDKSSASHIADAYATGPHELEINSYTNWTTIFVKKGDKIYIHASGSVTTGAFSGASGPAGKQYAKLWNIVADINYGALMVGVGTLNTTCTWHATGEDYVYTAPVNGYLRFNVNDSDPTDNQGTFTVNYSINTPLPHSPTPVQETTSPIPTPRVVVKSQEVAPEISPDEQKHLRAIYNKARYGDSTGPAKQYIPTRSSPVITFSGIATNTVNGKKYLCKGTMRLNNSGTYTLTGAFLIPELGSWDMIGRAKYKHGKTTFEFYSLLTLGKESGRSPDSKSTPFTVVLRLENQKLVGEFWLMGSHKENIDDAKGPLELEVN